MEKMNLETQNMTEKNIETIAKLFPNVITETKDENGELKKVVDFEKLKQELSDDVIEGEEAYDFTWVGKREAMVEANRPIRKTLRPNRESSVNWDTTENIYIEGDNLDALKLLQESYLGKVKMIYIDPPYNTGKDFVYRDNFTQDKDSYEEELGVKDEEGNRLFQNTESNGRFHSDWCSMMYPRLKLARNLLSDDGVIFISIDDNEVRNLKNICDEVFGEENIVASFIWQKKSSGGQHAHNVLDFHEYILVYSKHLSKMSEFSVPRTEKQLASFTQEDEYVKTRGKYLLSPLKSWLDYRKTLIYDIECPDGSVVNTQWVCAKDTYTKLKEEGRIVFKKNNKGEWSIYKKQYSSEDGGLVKPASIIYEYGQTMHGKKELKELFSGKDVMDFPKPTILIKYLCSMLSHQGSIILDFFSGSATTAHACMQLNAEDGGNRKFIMVQLPETTAETSEAFKAGYKNICEIGEERIRRAGKKIQEENPDKKLDIGFRVFKVDDTNMKDVYYAPKEYSQTQLSMFESNIKDDRTDEDLLYGCLLDWGVELSLPHKVETIDGKRVHIVNEDDLIACFEENISETVVKEIAKRQPTRVVFRDSSFSSDDNRINVEEIFKLQSPNTRVKVI